MENEYEIQGFEGLEDDLGIETDILSKKEERMEEETEDDIEEVTEPTEEESTKTNKEETTNEDPFSCF